jgi:hypothetical protein
MRANVVSERLANVVAAILVAGFFAGIVYAIAHHEPSGKPCGYECVQTFKMLRKHDHEWRDAMDPWKD